MTKFIIQSQAESSYQTCSESLALIIDSTLLLNGRHPENTISDRYCIFSRHSVCNFLCCFEVLAISACDRL